MGRRSDNPHDQAAKGFPGKRKTRVERQIAEAERLAEMLASVPPRAGDPLAPPAFIADPRLKGALAVWTEHAARLQRINLLDVEYRNLFAMFCVYMADFVAANDEILKKGYSVNVKTISGSMMPRENPNVSRRDVAADYVLKLSAKFGLTPLDYYALMKDQANRTPTGLFAGNEEQQKRGAVPSGDDAGDENAIGRNDHECRRAACWRGSKHPSRARMGSALHR
jgi:phage terminase small subunit